MQVFANRIAKVLKAAVTEAFIQEMIEKTCNEIKHKRWLHDAKFMHNYMDFHLAEWGMAEVCRRRPGDHPENCVSDWLSERVIQQSARETNRSDSGKR